MELSYVKSIIDYLNTEVLRKERVGKEGLSPFKDKWMTRFLQRHSNVKSYITKSIEKTHIEITKKQILWNDLSNIEKRLKNMKLKKRIFII